MVAAQPFRLPRGKPQDQIAYCLEIVGKQRNELRPLRTKLGFVSGEKTKWQKKAGLWQEKYQKEKVRNEKLKQEIEELKDIIEKITKTNNRFRISLFDHGNFKHKELGAKKPKGGQIGHPNTNREKHEDYTTWEKKRIFSKYCSRCKCELPRVEATRQKVLVDIALNPKIVKLIIESERQWCKTCKVAVSAKWNQTLPFTEYGMNTFIMVVILRFAAHASFANIAKVISQGFGLTLSKSDVSNLLCTARSYLDKRYDELVTQVRAGNLMYNDETGWQVGKESAWMWIMANDNVTVYWPALSRGKGIAKDMYGDSCAYSMHDGYASYHEPIPDDKKCNCWSHVLRFAYEETQELESNSPAVKVREELVAIYHIKRQNPDLSQAQLEQVLIKRLNALLLTKADDKSTQNILARVAKQKTGLVCALVKTPDGTNNLAERELRPIAIQKHISYGSNTYAGMQTTAIVASVFQTLTRKKDTNLTGELKQYLQEGVQDKYPQYIRTAYCDST